MFEKLFLTFNYLRFFPHILVFLVSSKKDVIREDLDAYKREYGMRGGAVATLVKLLAHNDSYRSLFYYRVGKVKWLIQWLGKGMDNLRLPLTAEIGSGLLLFHAYGTIFSSMCVVGKGCRVVHNVTIGDKKDKAPVIGDYVEILPNAVIAGDVHVGNHCVIGPGAVVYKSVPDNCVVVGNPAYILKKDGIIVNQKL
jgi:serine O-acetyltransferase